MNDVREESVERCESELRGFQDKNRGKLKLNQGGVIFIMKIR